MITNSNKKSKVNDAARHFDELPDSAFVPASTLSILYSCSVVTIWRWTKRGLLPTPIRMTNGKTAWRVGEIRAAMTEMQKKQSNRKISLSPEA